MSFNPLGVWQPLYRLIYNSFPFTPFCSLVMRSVVTILMWISFFPICTNEDQVSHQTLHQIHQI